MTVRAPGQYQTTEKDPLSAALEHEVMSEKAGTLSRLTKNLEIALERLQSNSEHSETDFEERKHLEEQAGEALWYVTIQRELCGLRQHKAFYDFLKVPAAVRLRMGPATSPKKLT